MELFRFVLHLDEHLANIVNQFGGLTYVLLFFIIFAETGLVVTPFLPGDSLLFAVGALSASGVLHIWLMYALFVLAAILGDTANYWIGHRIGPGVFSKKNSRIFNQEHLVKTQKFYEKYGGKTIILARFLPIVRTFAPFVAGVGKMHYRKFLMYNVIGGIIWVSLFVGLGFWFGRLPFVKKNFEYVVIGIVLISVVPVALEYLKHRREQKALRKDEAKKALSELKETLEKKDLKD